MEQNYNSGASTHSSVNVRCFSFLKSKIKLLFTLFFIFLGFYDALGQVTTDTYTITGAGTWTAPCGVTSVSVEAWGAGGAGGGNIANNSLGGGGGAGLPPA